ncbi:MAG: ATP-binding cassette domain-containing protein, partial [Actinomycetota bacterium]|nr:ATP-binding cassette domain-containing protein [Actinomycetota bacterium]
MSEAEAPSPPGSRAQGERLVSLHRIVKDFPRVRANDRVDFELRAGEIHALLGENGAGKTTLMNILAGLYRADRGEIAVLGEPPGAAAGGAAFIHQDLGLVESMSVADNVALVEGYARRWG